MTFNLLNTAQSRLAEELYKRNRPTVVRGPGGPDDTWGDELGAPHVGFTCGVLGPVASSFYSRTGSLESPWLRRHRAARARSCSLEHQLAFASISRKRCRALKLHTCLLEAAELPEKVAAHTRQQVVGLE